MKINEIYCGDSLELIKKVPDETIDLCITSPPYFSMRMYSQDTREIGQEQQVHEYMDKLLIIFIECVRTVKDSGSIIWNMGDKYFDRSLQLLPFKFAWRACEEAGVDLINMITWKKLNPTPRQCKRKMVNSTEPFFHFVKSNDYKYYPERLSGPKKSPRSDNHIGERYFEQIEKSQLSIDEKQCAKRDLSNAIAEIKSGKIHGIRMKIRGIHSLPFGGQEGGRIRQINEKGYSIIKLKGNSMLKDVIECPVECVRGGKHPAIYPQFIVEKFIHLTTEEGDTIFDPFSGSGTTACAAVSTKRNYLGFELNPDFVKQSHLRICNLLQKQKPVIL
jgi:DNA modification methylase